MPKTVTTNLADIKEETRDFAEPFVDALDKLLAQRHKHKFKIAGEREAFDQPIRALRRVVALCAAGFDPMSLPQGMTWGYVEQIAKNEREGREWPTPDGATQYRVFASIIPVKAQEAYLVARDIVGVHHCAIASAAVDDFRSFRPISVNIDPMMFARAVGVPDLGTIHFRVAQWDLKSDLGLHIPTSLALPAPSMHTERTAPEPAGGEAPQPA